MGYVALGWITGCFFYRFSGIICVVPVSTHLSSTCGVGCDFHYCQLSVGLGRFFAADFWENDRPLYFLVCRLERRFPCDMGYVALGCIIGCFFYRFSGIICVVPESTHLSSTCGVGCDFHDCQLAVSFTRFFVLC